MTTVVTNNHRDMIGLLYFHSIDPYISVKLINHVLLEIGANAIAGCGYRIFDHGDYCFHFSDCQLIGERDGVRTYICCLEVYKLIHAFMVDITFALIMNLFDDLDQLLAVTGILDRCYAGAWVIFECQH